MLRCWGIPRRPSAISVLTNPKKSIRRYEKRPYCHRLRHLFCYRHGAGTSPAAQENPIEISAERKDEGGLVTLRLVGKYEASFMVTEPEQ